jgi:N-acetylmuramoyl-L-alanine amidase
VGSRRTTLLVAVLLALAAAGGAHGGNPQVAGLQVALKAHGLYTGAIDGVSGPGTVAAVKLFQAQKGLAVDGRAGQRTRAALGPLGRPLLGRRDLARGAVGLDVSVLQFLLRARGFCSDAPTGAFDARTAAAVRAFQKAHGLIADGIAGPRTLAALAVQGVPVAPKQPSTRIHVVRAGESLTAIADRFGTTLAALARRNRLDPARVLLVGTRLRVPAGSPAPVRAAVSTRSPASYSREDVRDAIDRWSAVYGVDQQLARGLAWMESGFQNHVVSSAGARGVMQLLPSSMEFVQGVLLGQQVDTSTVDGNVQLGVRLLAHLLREWNGDVRLAVAGWYQGSKAVRERGVLPESEAFVADVLALRGRV